MAERRDYYELLGVAHDATNDQLKRAYRKLAMRHHPNLFLFTELSAIDLDTDVFALTWQNANGKPTKLTV